MQFIEQYVRSVEQLEIVLLLGRNPEKDFRVEDVYNVIMSTTDSVQGWLKEMVAKNLAVQNAGPPVTFLFTPSDPGLLDTVQLLASSYKAYPVRVIEAIYRPRQQPPPSAQTDPAQGFADAFRLRKN
ncbi:MAG TPA: hypothetical protein VLE43_21000 [Candidatus Saccharimonadia bacterium]|nr:hypothetical protein [Candidatus Saccharimonadia bacterium]